MNPLYYFSFLFLPLFIYFPIFLYFLVYPLDFIDGRYPLDAETPSVAIDDVTYELGGKYFTDLDIECQQELLRFKFMIYGFEDADDDLIEEIFFRLNNSTPLSKPQKAILDYLEESGMTEEDADREMRIYREIICNFKE